MKTNGPNLDTNEGTPKTLEEAIAMGLCFGPLTGIDRRLYVYIKDFLAQRFTVAMFAHPEFEDELKELFEEIVKRRFSEPAKTIEQFKNDLK